MINMGDILSTVGVFSTVGDIMSTVGSYLEYRGGNFMIPRGGNFMMLKVILSTVGGVQYRGGYHPLKFEYHGGIS